MTTKVSGKMSLLNGNITLKIYLHQQEQMILTL